MKTWVKVLCCAMVCNVWAMKQENKVPTNDSVIIKSSQKPAEKDEDRSRTCASCLGERNNYLYSCLAEKPCENLFCFTCINAIFTGMANGQQPTCPCCKEFWFPRNLVVKLSPAVCEEQNSNMAADF